MASSVEMRCRYGDTFIEMLKCECLIAGPFANFFKIELAAKNADPNYGVCWLNRFGAKKAIDNANEDEKLPLAPWH